MTRIISLILCSILMASCSQNCTNPNPFIDYSSEVDVSRIVDGDTFDFLIKGEEFSVRVLNIDCFETKHNDRLKGQAERAGISVDSAYVLGHIAKNLADSLLTGKRVRILRDSTEEDFDAYGRLLRVVLINNMRYDSILKARGLGAPVF